jgi:hypothetical protein
METCSFEPEVLFTLKEMDLRNLSQPHSAEETEILGSS